MTSVPQLPVEASEAIALPKGETPRRRANHPLEEGVEGAFAALLAHVLPARQEAAKAELTVSLPSLGVEGEDPPAEEVEVAASSDAGGAARSGAAVAAEAPTASVQAAPVPMPEHVQDSPLVSKLGGKEDLEQAIPADGEYPAPKLAKLQAVAPTPMGREHTPQAAPIRSEETPQTETAQPAKPRAQQAPQVENGTDSKRSPEAPARSKIEAPRVGDSPSLAFQVRRTQPEDHAGRSPVIADRAALQRTEASQTAPMSAPGQATEQRLAPLQQVRPAAAEVEQREGPNDSPRSTTPRDAVVQEGAHLPPKREEPGHTRSGPDEPEEQTPPPNRLGAGVVRTPSNSVVDAQAEADRPAQAGVKPTSAATTTTQGSNTAPPSVAVNAVPPEAPFARPTEEARPAPPSAPLNEPEINAKLQQQGGRTTLNVVLHDERLGRVALHLVERGGWIETAIRASDPRAAQMLANNAAGLFEALQQRGMALASGGGTADWDAQEGQRRDDLHREQDSQRRRFRLRRAGGEFEGALARAEV